MKGMLFRSFDLQADPYKVVNEEGLYNSPAREIIAHELARSDNAVAVFRKYRPRNFTLSGNMKAASEAVLEAAIDQLKYNLLNQIGDLRVEWAGGYRYFNAECQNVIINRDRGDINRCGWSAGFYMAVPFSTDNTTRNFMTAVSGWTAGSLSVAVSNIGTFLAYPFLTLTLTDINPNVSDVSFTISNPATNEQLTITGTFADGDIITIDTFKKQIFKGTTQLVGVGQFPAWLPGNGLLQLSDTGSSRNISLTATYQARYL